MKSLRTFRLWQVFALPAFPAEVGALTNFMRLSLTKAAHVVVAGAAYRKCGLVAWVLILTASALAANRYIVTNDDTGFPFITGVSFYTMDGGGLLTLQGQVQTGGYGISGGYFGASHIAVLDNGQQACVFASEATTGDIVGILVRSLALGGRA